MEFWTFLYRTGDIIVILLMGRGLSGATFTFYCQETDSNSRAAVAATTILAVWIIVAGGLLAAFLFAGSLSTLLKIQDANLTRMGMIAAFSQLLLVVPLALMQARMESVAFVVTSVISALARLIIILWAVVMLRGGIEGVLWGTIISSCTTSVCLFFREFRQVGFRLDVRRVPAILGFSLPFVPVGVLGFIRACNDRYFLLDQWGPDEVGIFALGSRIATIVSTIAFAPLFKVWSAWLYKVYARPNAEREVGEYLTRLVAPFMFLALGVILFKDEVVRVLSSEAYSPSAFLIGPLCIGQGFVIAQTLFDGTFYYFRRSAVKIWIMMATVIASIALNAILIPRLGAKARCDFVCIA